MRLVLCALQIHYEDFRNFSENFGMQLDDDSLLALYFVHDPEGRYAHLLALGKRSCLSLSPEQAADQVHAADTAVALVDSPLCHESHCACTDGGRMSGL
jgi:hypothetical protein